MKIIPFVFFRFLAAMVGHCVANSFAATARKHRWVQLLLCSFETKNFARCTFNSKQCSTISAEQCMFKNV